MLDVCEAEGCERLVDVDGYFREVHGVRYCDRCQPTCPTCGCYVFKGECWGCDLEALGRAQAKMGELYNKRHKTNGESI